ncbi:MAG: hypothetical protein ACRDIV_22120 [Ktedonobacteraceae bacterium]
MPIVISEFEVVAESPHARAEGESAPGSPGDEAIAAQDTGVPTPHDIEVVVRHIKERLARVRVY